MSCNISGEDLNNPLLKELLQKLTDYFQSIGSDFYIIGATARDIILSAIHKQASARRTADLDIAIAIKDWDKFKQISEELCKIDGFSKDPEQTQKFKFRNIYEVDIVPFGEIAKADNNIYWPPEEQFAMSVAGYTEVADNTLDIAIDNDLSVKVASLPGIFILKLAAFNDRKSTTNKDADDLAFIIENYLNINEVRAAAEHYDIYEAEDFNTFTAGATLLGRDIKSILGGNEETINTFIQILEEELMLEEESPLINQMIETHKTIEYDLAVEALNNLLQELKK
ncbi:MAG: nucleotidyl transferase AbiEii/AbiGii toxin family protein [Bacteroidota bacterium]|nr:nucleotidyl transferase AbiEii/AbiGii toxin family protein [Bacteroidota bacterium]